MAADDDPIGRIKYKPWMMAAVVACHLALTTHVVYNNLRLFVVVMLTVTRAQMLTQVGRHESAVL